MRKKNLLDLSNNSGRGIVAGVILRQRYSREFIYEAMIFFPDGGMRYIRRELHGRCNIAVFHWVFCRVVYQERAACDMGWGTADRKWMDVTVSGTSILLCQYILHVFVCLK